MAFRTGNELLPAVKSLLKAVKSILTVAKSILTVVEKVFPVVKMVLQPVDGLFPGVESLSTPGKREFPAGNGALTAVEAVLLAGEEGNLPVKLKYEFFFSNLYNLFTLSLKYILLPSNEHIRNSAIS